MRKIAILAPIGAFSLSGCLGVVGPDTVVGLRGEPTQTVQGTIFAEDFRRAYCIRSYNQRASCNGGAPKVPASIPTPAPSPSPTPSPAPVSSAARDGQNNPYIRPMVRSGMMYVRTYCSDYFRSMAVEQRKSRIVRDSIAPITALIAGIAGVRDLGFDGVPEDDILTGAALWAVGTGSVLDIFDEHLLFGANNIDSVRGLAMEALGVHRVAVMGNIDTYEFEDAVEALLEHQNICSPQSLLALTKEAIEAGDPKVENGKSLGDSAAVPEAYKNLIEGLENMTPEDRAALMTQLGITVADQANEPAVIPGRPKVK